MAVVQSFVKDLEPELSGLGLSDQNLEEQVDRLDQRVSERERIRFRGQCIAQVNSMSFFNASLGGAESVPKPLATAVLSPHSRYSISRRLEMNF